MANSIECPVSFLNSTRTRIAMELLAFCRESLVKHYDDVMPLAQDFCVIESSQQPI